MKCKRLSVFHSVKKIKQKIISQIKNKEKNGLKREMEMRYSTQKNNVDSGKVVEVSAALNWS